MDLDEAPKRKADVLRELATQDLDPLSHDECAARIAALEAEIARTRAHMTAVSRHRSAAESLFRR